MPHSANDNGYRLPAPSDPSMPPVPAAASATVASDPPPAAAATAGPPAPAELNAPALSRSSRRSPSPQKRKAPPKKPPTTKKAREKKDDVELQCLFMDKLEEAAKKDACPDTHGKCKCMRVLQDVAPREAVAKYCVWLERTHDKRMKDQKVLEWIRLAKLAHGSGTQQSSGRPKLMFPILYD